MNIVRFLFPWWFKWRVLYRDGQRSVPLRYSDAKARAYAFGGKLEARSVSMKILVIDLNPREQICHRCNVTCSAEYGLPVGPDGGYVPNWYEGEWAGVPSCRTCYEWHERRSEATDPNRVKA